MLQQKTNPYKKLLERLVINGADYYLLEKIGNEELETEKFIKMFDPDRDIIAAGAFSGLFAIAHHRSLTGDGFFTHLHIYSISRRLIKKIAFSIRSRLISLSITKEELIMSVFANGAILFHSPYGGLISETPKLVSDGVTVDIVATSEKFVYAFDNNNNLYTNDGKRTTSLHVLVENLPFKTVKATCISSPASLTPALLCLTDKGALFSITGKEYASVSFPDEIRDFHPSPFGNRLAFVTRTQIIVTDSLVSRVLFSVSTPDATMSSFTWFTTEQIGYQRGTSLTFINSECHELTLAMNEPFFVSSELDCVHIVQRGRTRRLRSFPKQFLGLIKWDEDNSSVKLMEYALNPALQELQDLTDMMNEVTIKEAVMTLCSFIQYLADHDLRFFTIQRLATLCMNLDSSNEKASRIRQMLSYRIEGLVKLSRISKELGMIEMPLTLSQIIAIGFPFVLRRLCNRHHHIVAYSIAKYIGIEYSSVTKHWAHSLVTSEWSDQKILEQTKKMDEEIDYVQMAHSAYKIGRNDLALAILSINKVKSKSVHLLISQRNYREGIEASLKSGDPSLIQYALSEARAAGQRIVLNEYMSENALARSSLARCLKGEARLSILSISKSDTHDRVLNHLDGKQPFDTVKTLLKGRDEEFYLEVIETNKFMESIRTDLTKAGHTLAKGATPYDILDKCIEVDDTKLIKAVVKQLNLSKSEYSWRVFSSAVRKNSRDLLIRLKSESPELLPDFIRVSERRNLSDVLAILRDQ